LFKDRWPADDGGMEVTRRKGKKQCGKEVAFPGRQNEFWGSARARRGAPGPIGRNVAPPA
jgi:hypothetical protein